MDWLFGCLNFVSRILTENTIVSARRCRGILRGRLTRIEQDIANLEDKEELALQDRHKVERLLEQINDNDTNFEQRSLEVLNFIEEEDQDTLSQDEAVFDEHVNRVAELVERMEQLDIPEKASSTPTRTTAPHSFCKLAKRLKYIKQQREAITIIAFWD